MLNAMDPNVPFYDLDVPEFSSIWMSAQEYRAPSESQFVKIYHKTSWKKSGSEFLAISTPTDASQDEWIKTKRDFLFTPSTWHYMPIVASDGARMIWTACGVIHIQPGNLFDVQQFVSNAANYFMMALKFDDDQNARETARMSWTIGHQRYVSARFRGRWRISNKWEED
jgi:hypothetical protein